MSSSVAIAKILLKYKQREELSVEETAELKRWLRESPKHERLFDDLSNTARWDRELGKWKGDPDATWNKIRKRVEALSPGTFQNKKSTQLIRYLAAAAAIALISTVIFWWHNRKQLLNTDTKSNVVVPHNILPQSGSTTLTLGDGSVIQLDTIKSGMVARQGNTNIIKSDSAALSYQGTVKNNQPVEINTLSTPKGTQYRLILPDGSKVWLNAATTLKFPAFFWGGARKVELTGEAYFEVTKNKAMPFIVQTNRSMSVRVLGTHFNISAYPDEPLIKTTLMEGSVSVNNGKDSVMITPGQQVRYGQSGLDITEANDDQVSAWRNKLFWFQKAHFDEVMRQLARWYDIDVVYEGKLDQSYTGILPTSLPLENILNILEKGGNVRFTVGEGNKVTVRP